MINTFLAVALGVFGIGTSFANVFSEWSTIEGRKLGRWIKLGTPFASGVIAFVGASAEGSFEWKAVTAVVFAAIVGIVVYALVIRSLENKERITPTE